MADHAKLHPMTRTVAILDGGMGRELLRVGAPFRQPEWSALALMEGPEWVVKAHRNFIEAGADIITTNSYALVPFHIGDDVFSTRGQELAGLSGRLAREAVDGSSVLVAGSLPPLFGSYRPDLFDAEDAARVIDPLVAGLADHVDVWLGETLGSIAEAVAVRDAIERAGSGQPLWLSYTLADQPNGTLRSGELVADAVVAAVLDLGADAVLFNCCSAESITAAITTATTVTAGLVATKVAIGGYANRFVTAHTEAGEANEGISELRPDLAPDHYADVVQTWIGQGATLVGGCCGIEPGHIAEIARRVRAHGYGVAR
jgi:S-methylmethionine-dependent homocysteine/selenocysteine methylase